MAIALTDTEAEEIPPLSELYTKYSPAIARYLRRRLIGFDAAVSEDLTADTFERVARSIHTYVPGEFPITAWLYTIAQNLLTDFYRHQAVEKRRMTDLPDDNYQEMLPPVLLPDPAVALALDILPERLRMLVVAHWIDRKTIAEIATESGRTERYVRRALHKGLVALREELLEEVEIAPRVQECSGLDLLASSILAAVKPDNPPYPFCVRYTAISDVGMEPRIMVYE